MLAREGGKVVVSHASESMFFSRRVLSISRRPEIPHDPVVRRTHRPDRVNMLESFGTWAGMGMWEPFGSSDC